MAEDLKARWPRMVKPPQLDEYAERYAEFFKFERRDGILEVRMHTNDGPWTQDGPATTPLAVCSRRSVLTPRTKSSS